MRRWALSGGGLAGGRGGGPVAAATAIRHGARQRTWRATAAAGDAAVGAAVGVAAAAAAAAAAAKAEVVAAVAAVAGVRRGARYEFNFKHSKWAAGERKRSRATISRPTSARLGAASADACGSPGGVLAAPWHAAGGAWWAAPLAAVSYGRAQPNAVLIDFRFPI